MTHIRFRWPWHTGEDVFDIARTLHTYSLDLERLTMLRDKARNKDETERYTNIVEVAQKTLERLLELSDATK